jgi:hypothetical protein
MANARYILRVSDGRLFGFCDEWLKLPGMMEYNPEVHGYRAEVAVQLGLVAPAPTVTPRPAVVVSEHVAGQTITPPTTATKSKKTTEAQSSEPDLSDVFDRR